MQKEYDVIALGELLVDFVQQDTNEVNYPILSGYPGGAPCNFLAVSAKYGGKCQLIAAVGEDELGALLLDTVKEKGIGTQFVNRLSDYFTTLAFVTIDEFGDRHFSFARKHSADTQIEFDKAYERAILSSRVFHFGSLSLTDEPARNATQKCVEYALANKVWVNYDPNYRALLWQTEAIAIEQMRWGIAHCNSLKLSQEEFEFIYNKPITFASQIFAEYPNLQFALITRGSEGALGFYQNQEIHVKGIDDIQVVDTTGAGDIFGGAVLWHLLMHKQDLNQIEAKDIQVAMEFANCCAALSTTKHGGISSIPELYEVHNFLNDKLNTMEV